MKKIIAIVSLLLMSAINASASEYLLPDSNQKYLKEEDLKGRTKTFFRYARNEIFARKGLEFKDEDLKIFFNSMPWYKRNTKISIDSIALSPIEKANVELLNKLEQSIKDAEPLKILYRYEVDKLPLFYIGKPDYYQRYISGNFILLDTKYLWTLQCKTIPPEFIINKGLSIFEVSDECCELDPEQIVLKDIDVNSEGNTDTEVVIYLEGPSGDPELVVLGFDPNKKFRKLLNLRGEVQQMKKIAPNRLLIEMETRNQLAGTSFGYSSFIYNTITKTIYKVPDIFIESSSNYSVTCKQKVNIYFDARSALNEKKEAIIGVIHENISVQIVKYYMSEERGYSVLVKGEKIEGWVSGNDITMENFTLSNAD